MTSFRFGEFTVDVAERRLLDGGAPVELSARYFDALVLLLAEAGRLVTKDRFMAEVWGGIPVTDEALTQCIRTLRRALGDSAGAPRFIETVPKHGYRFIAPVVRGMPEREDAPSPPASPVSPAVTVAAAVSARPPAEAAGAPVPSALPARAMPALEAVPRRLLLATAGTLGAGFAGVVGGILFGFVAAAQGGGAASALVVLVCITVFVALAGGAGVAAGVAATARDPERPWRAAIAGGAAGGLAVGAVAKLLGLDAFDLLLGRSPGDITGAVEGLVLGAAVGAGLWWAGRGRAASAPRAALSGAVAGAAAGVLLTLGGGRLMAGSLALLGQAFPGSRLRLDAVGALFGEHGLGRVGEVVLGGVEGGLFAACVAGAMALAHHASRAEADRAGAADQAGRSGGASNADA